jgi:hypothetical protein
MNRFEKCVMWVTSILTVVTGLGFFWAKYLTQTDEPWAVINHPLQPWFLKAHILVVPLFIFAVGAVSLRHFWLHWVNGVLHGRTSGALAALTVAPLILTGYLLQVVTHEFLLSVLAITHIVLGIVFFGGMLLHQVFVRRRRRAGDDEVTLDLHRSSRPRGPAGRITPGPERVSAPDRPASRRGREATRAG